MKHADTSESLIRPPGTAPSTCRGELHRVDGAGVRIDEDSPPVLDACLPREGEPHRFSAVRLRRCSICCTTLVEATAPDGTGHQRNSWSPSAWCRPTGRPEPAALA